MNKQYTNINNLMVTKTYKAMSQSNELDISLKDVINNILEKNHNMRQTQKKKKKQWTKKETIKKKQEKIKNKK